MTRVRSLRAAARVLRPSRGVPGWASRSARFRAFPGRSLPGRGVVFGALSVLLLAGGAAAEGQSIRWSTSARDAVAEAQRTRRPLMVYVLAGTRDRDNDVERDQRRSLADPRVVRLAQQFVPLRLSRSADRAILKDFHLPESANMVISFVAPDGSSLGEISAGGIARTESLIQKLVAVRKLYVTRVFDAEIRPVLEDAEAPADALRRALALARELRVEAADKPLVALLERPRLEPALRTLTLETLAGLSTRPAVSKLLELSAAGDAAATEALGKCTPVGAELLVAELKADAQPFNYPLYRAIARICGLRDVKPERFFESAQERYRQQEIDELRARVAAAAARWRSENDPAR